jgi:hypothetical protein
MTARSWSACDSPGGDTPVTTLDRPFGRFSHKSITPSLRRQPSIPLEASWHIAERAAYAISLHCARRSRVHRLTVYCGRRSGNVYAVQASASICPHPAHEVRKLPSGSLSASRSSRLVKSTTPNGLSIGQCLLIMFIYAVAHPSPQPDTVHRPACRAKVAQLLTLFLVISCRDVVANVCVGVLSMHVCFCVPIVRPCRRQKWFIRV